MDYLKIIFLLVYYTGLLALCGRVSKKVIITPEFCFVLSFIPHLFYALFYVKRWDLDLDINTMLVYIFGGMVFFITSLVFSELLGTTKISSSNNWHDVRIRTNKLFLILFLIFQLVSLYITAYTVKQLTNRPNIVEAIDMFGFLSKGSGLQMPSIPGKLNMICYASSYIWLYDILHSILYKYKTHFILLFANLLLSVIHHVMTGSRGGVVELIVAGMVFLYFFRGDIKNWKKVITSRNILIGVGIGVITLFLFRFSLEMLGRTGVAGETISDYVARYLSASLKNIDTKIRSGIMGFWGIEQWKTTNSIMSFISKVFRLNIKRNIASADTYMSVNGFGLGNVYTIYYPMIYDLHYFGLFVFIPIMSFVLQFIYKSALKFNRYNGGNTRVSLSLILYGYAISKTLFSFFSNRFFDNILSMGTVWLLLFWWIVKCGSEKRFAFMGITIRIKAYKKRLVQSKSNY